MRKSQTLTIVFFLFTLGLYSCKRNWECNVINAEFLCIKGEDSVYINTSISPDNRVPNYNYSPTFAQNLVNYYRQNGYLIDTIFDGTTSESIGSIETVKAYEANGITCIEDRE